MPLSEDQASNPQLMESSSENIQRPRANRRSRVAAACETCKRRKERCDGLSPCLRCSQRGVAEHCRFVERTRNTTALRRKGLSQSRVASPGIARYSPYGPRDAEERQSITSPDGSLPTTGSFNSGLHARLIRDQRGRFMFIGDSANLSFLQVIRKVVGDSVGSCSFVDDPLRSLMVESSPDGQPSWLNHYTQCAPPKVLLEDAHGLLTRYVLATSCVLDMFDQSELEQNVALWATGRERESTIPVPIVYLVLAIGAQTSPENKEALAESLFNYGRYLTAQNFMEDASILTVQSYALITFFLLGASRRNAAFMYLGIAVRAAYAIGLHRREVAVTFPPDECKSRERLWKVIRILDLFMSASLGRPPSTSETRDTEGDEGYSTSNDLCNIFEKILNDVYSRRMISTEALNNIGAHHRRWASRMFRGLAEDNIQDTDVLVDTLLPNIGLLHIKGAYYWTIILLTRPFLIESVTLHLRKAISRTSEPFKQCINNNVLVNACVDSAIRVVELNKKLLDCRALPKRLPFIVNSIFIAALVLGFAHWGDLYQIFPLSRYLKIAHRLLANFSEDHVSQRNASIIAYLIAACEIYTEKQISEHIKYQSLAVRSIFGQVHHLQTQASTRSQTPSRAFDDPSGPDRVNGDGSDESSRMNLEITNEALSGVTDFDMDDFGNLPYPPMTPRTLLFDSLDENMPLFTLVGNADEYFNNLPTSS